MMIQRWRQAGIFLDGENFISFDNEDLCYIEKAIVQIGNSMRIFLGRQGMYPAANYCRLYLESRAIPTRAILDICRKARLHGFRLRWTVPHQPAESLLVADIDNALENDSMAMPQSIFIMSGDGAVIRVVQKLRETGRTVTVVAMTERIHHILREQASSFLTMEQIFAEVVHL